VYIRLRSDSAPSVQRLLNNKLTTLQSVQNTQFTSKQLLTDTIVLCTKLDAECDRQATVVGLLLTTLGDDEHAVAKLFLFQRLEKSSRGNYAYFWRYSDFVFA